MEVTLKQFFSIGDGRLSTEIGDVYQMLNYIFSENFFTHQLPTAMRRLIELNPKWFSDAVSVIDEIKSKVGSDDFTLLIEAIDKGYSNLTVKLEKVESQFSLLDGLV